MGTKFCYCPLKILWTCKESAKTLVIRIWFYAWLYFYCFKSLLIVISEEKSWWNPCWNTDGYLCNCASSLMCYNRFSGCPNFCLRLSHFPFIFNIPPNLQLQCTILDGYQIQNDLTLSMVDASSSSSEIPWITMLCNGVIFWVISHARCLLSRLLLMSKIPVFFLQSMVSLQKHLGWPTGLASS